MAGAVHRASWLPFVWQAQYTQLPGQAAARVAAAGPRLPFVSLITHHSSLHHFSHFTHHTTHHYTTSHISLITPRVWQAQYTEPPGPRLPHSSLHHFSHLTHHTMRVAGAVHRASWPAAAFRVAGAVHRASWLPFVWQAQYTELPGQAAARVAAAGPRLPVVSLITHHSSLHHALITSHSSHHSCGWRSTQSLLEELRRVAGAVRRALAAAGPRLPFMARGRRWPAAAFRVAGAVHTASWTSCGARGRRWPAAAFVSLITHHSPLHHFSHLTHQDPTHHYTSAHISLMTPRVWQAQYRASWPAAAFRVAGAVHRASWTSCGARGRRWPAAACRVTHHTPLITAPLIISHLTHHTTRVAGAVHRASWRRVAAAGPRLPFLWQAQYTEPPGGAAAGYPANFGLLARCWASAPSIPHRNSMALKDGLCNAAF